MFANLSVLPNAPSVQMQPIPDDAMEVDASDDEEDDKHAMEKRITLRASDKRIVNENELSDSEDEDGDERRDTGPSHNKKICTNAQDVAAAAAEVSGGVEGKKNGTSETNVQSGKNSNEMTKENTEKNLKKVDSSKEAINGNSS